MRAVVVVATAAFRCVQLWYFWILFRICSYRTKVSLSLSDRAPISAVSSFLHSVCVCAFAMHQTNRLPTQRIHENAVYIYNFFNAERYSIRIDEEVYRITEWLTGPLPFTPSAIRLQTALHPYVCVTIFYCVINEWEVAIFVNKWEYRCVVLVVAHI